MGASAKTLSRIVAFVESGTLPIGGAVVELGAQQLRCAPGDVLRFLEFFAARADDLSISRIESGEIQEFCSGGYLGNLLKRARFKYASLDIFHAVETTLFDLNLHFVPEAMRCHFDLVTNYGTTEHIINQMLAMRTMHDLAKAGGIIHHELPLSGCHLHGYFNYNPGLFDDLGAANSYEVILQSFQGGVRKDVPDFMRRGGYREGPWRDYSIEVAFRKTSDAPFRIPVDTISSVDISSEIWTAGEGHRDIGITINSPAHAEVLLSRLPLRTLQAAYLSKLRRGVRERLWRAIDRRRPAQDAGSK
jgi:methyltransferase family protein